MSKIMIVDDDPNIREFVHLFTETLHYRYISPCVFGGPESRCYCTENWLLNLAVW